ncbi:hypothetical protein [Azospirillum thiophilum]|uniref:Integrase n=1 Tax=Azospirillum thiophilum TaxID=528244 RepID=A0AAC8W6G0_9PROT|nr:hypothetical protein [Azospirillum thiophilum]ALG75725.1 hypothetical protein AL072_32810 [Azospirillum thiophilum]
MTKDLLSIRTGLLPPSSDRGKPKRLYAPAVVTVALDLRDVSERPEGLVLRIRVSKTSQTGDANHISAHKAIWRAGAPNDPCCPVRAWEEWCAVRGTQEPTAPLFVGLKKYGWPTDKRLSGESVADIVRRLITAVALSDEPEDRPWRRLIERDRHGDGTEEVVTDKNGQPVLLGRWSGHSLRSGLATEAGRHGQSLTSVMKQTRSYGSEGCGDLCPRG